jgi:TQXA domain-containing protein
MTKIYQYKNLIQKHKRRIYAYLRQSQIRRIKVYLMLILFLSFNLKSIFAIENSNIYYGDYKIECYKDPYMYITYNEKMQPNYEYYYIKDGIQYPAYCLNLGSKGAEDYNGYVVSGNTKITDEKLQLIILNSYPYKTVEELGLNNTNEAIFASQFAIWCYIENMDLNLIKPISDMNIKLVETIKNIYNSKDGNLTQNDINLNFNVSNQETECINGKDYYKKNIELDVKNINKLEINVEDNDVIIKEENNIYSIYVPVEKVVDKYNVNVSFKVNAKENVALFGKSTMDGFQNLAITLKDNFDVKLEKEIEFEKYESNINIIKIDKDTNEKIDGVKFLVTDNYNNKIGEYTTNENGNLTITLNNTDVKEINIKEIETKKGYKLEEEVYNIKVLPNDDVNLNIYNEKQKGTIEVIKKTKEYNEYTKLPENTPLMNVEFQILDEENNVVDSVITNEFGIAKTIKLPLGKYYIKEIKTNEYYNLSEELIEIQIDEDEENVKVTILNDNIFKEEKLPVTGR